MLTARWIGARNWKPPPRRMEGNRNRHIRSLCRWQDTQVTRRVPTKSPCSTGNSPFKDRSRPRSAECFRKHNLLERKTRDSDNWPTSACIALFPNFGRNFRPPRSIPNCAGDFEQTVTPLSQFASSPRRARPPWRSLSRPSLAIRGDRALPRRGCGSFLAARRPLLSRHCLQRALSTDLAALLPISRVIWRKMVLVFASMRAS